jgi:uncharacterized membrane protein
MSDTNTIPTQRLEAFSDGVIAIIITVMVFELKWEEAPTLETLGRESLRLLPRLGSYALSFLTLAILWISHHQLFHQIRQADSGLLWWNLNLLFWMSLVPFSTHFIGDTPMFWVASSVYGFNFALCAWSFSMIRRYVIKKALLHPTILKEKHYRILTKNRLALTLYIAGAVLSIMNVFVSFALFLIVPALYVIPEKITHKEI